MVMPGWSSGTRNRVMPWCLGASGSVRAPTQYHSAKWAEVVHVFWPLSSQPSPSRDGLQLHGGGVGSGVGLAVADGELDLVAEDLGQELGLQLVGPVLDQRLADDADALADLRGAPAGQRLVEQVLVDALALGPPYSLGQVMPSQPRSPTWAMNARRFGVSTICAMFSRVRSMTSGSWCSSRNASTSATNCCCSSENSKSMRVSSPPGMPAGRRI